MAIKKAKLGMTVVGKKKDPYETRQDKLEQLGKRFESPGMRRTQKRLPKVAPDYTTLKNRRSRG